MFEEAKEKAEEQLLLDGAKELLRSKESNNGQLPYGSVPAMLKKLGCPGITRHKLRHKMNEIEKQIESGIATIDTNVSTREDDVSEITNPTSIQSPSTLHTVTTATSSSSGGRNKGGRPKKIAKTFSEQELRVAKKEATTRVCLEYELALQLVPILPRIERRDIYCNKSSCPKTSCS